MTHETRSLLIDARDNPVIILNNSLVGTAKGKARFRPWERFLIAHELGHLVLHQRGAKGPSGASEYWKLEKLCDAFARRLLIPEQIVTRLLNGTGSNTIQKLMASLAVVNECSVPWSIAALRVADVNNGTVFLHLAPEQAGGFKIVVSTCRNQQGLGQRIKPGTQLYKTLCEPFISVSGPREIDGRSLSGIAGIQGICSGAAHPVRGSLRIALIPSP